MTFAQLMELAMTTAKTAMMTMKTLASIFATMGRPKEATTKNATSIDSLVPFIFSLLLWRRSLPILSGRTSKRGLG